MNKTTPTNQNVEEFLDSIADATQREDSRALVELMGQISGQPPVMWGTGIVGFGNLRYKYASGREGDWMKIGFSPRKGNLTLYLMCDINKVAPYINAIGEHKTGKGCLYIKKLADVNLEKLTELIRMAYSEVTDA
jgi:hypothetical protein